MTDRDWSELMWWRMEFATRFRTPPEPGTALYGVRYRLVEDTVHVAPKARGRLRAAIAEQLRRVAGRIDGELGLTDTQPG